MCVIHTDALQKPDFLAFADHGAVFYRRQPDHLLFPSSAAYEPERIVCICFSKHSGKKRKLPMAA